MKGKRILVIEDEFLIGVEIESILKASGAKDVGSAATEEEALRQIEHGTWDAVVADANLNGRGIQRIAHILVERSIPLLVVTGYGLESLPPEVRQSPVLTKPFRASQLVGAISPLLT
jgi:CheY-like chemotaxis protein